MRIVTLGELAISEYYRRMNKRKLRHYIKKLRPISPWYLLALCLVFSVVAIYALRNNNLTAIKLRNEVLKTDQQNGDVETVLRNLREYMYAHMNTDLSSGPNAIKPPIQLKYSYDRLVQAEQSKINASNSQIYNDAQKYCEQQIPTEFSGRGRVPCIQNYVSTHGVKEQSIPTSLYEFDFISPFWSPDLAGWSLIFAALLLALFVMRFLVDLWLKTELKDIS